MNNFKYCYHGNSEDKCPDCKEINQLNHKIKSLEGELKVCKAFHNVAVEQRDAEIKRADRLDGFLRKLGYCPCHGEWGCDEYAMRNRRVD